MIYMIKSYGDTGSTVSGSVQNDVKSGKPIVKVSNHNFRNDYENDLYS